MGMLEWVEEGILGDGEGIYTYLMKKPSYSDE